MICIVTIETPVNIRRTGIATNRASGEHRRKPLRERERRRTGRGERGKRGIAGVDPDRRGTGTDQSSGDSGLAREIGAIWIKGTWCL